MRTRSAVRMSFTDTVSRFAFAATRPASVKRNVRYCSASSCSISVAFLLMRWVGAKFWTNRLNTVVGMFHLVLACALAIARSTFLVRARRFCSFFFWVLEESGYCKGTDNLEVASWPEF